MGNIEEKFASLLVQILSHQNVPGSMDVARRLVRDNRKSINELIREAKEIGWHTRDADKGTYYEIGWDHAPDEENGEEYWNTVQTTTSLSHAQATSYRWGCDYRVIRNNPFETKGTGEGK
jgi:hypothetical protein